MFVQVKISYRTVNGNYRTVFCHLDHPDVYFGDEYVQRWALSQIPAGAHIVGVQMGWATLEPDKIILMRIQSLSLPGKTSSPATDRTPS